MGQWRGPVITLLILACAIATYTNGIWAFAWSIDMQVTPTTSAPSSRVTAYFDEMNRESNRIFVVREVAIVLLAVAGLALILRGKGRIGDTSANLR